ncbi:MAG: MAPEG family protein, partial [Alphaproteobacteria bacterium]|nr:MAPEG family protein [Alphaproteobacteria bacterium]
GKWPEDVRKIANKYQNQFEVPVLYFALLPLLLATGKADGVSVVLSWAFVASRVAHSIVHLGANVVLTRFRLFVLGFSLVALMWAWFGLRLYVIG